jgi:ABC-type oligopeptide transport system substrate-binding subunit/transcriptional regulator with XRE-family HTH domain
MATTVSFGYWVRRQRKALDLTQAALAADVGCAAVTISKIERDERRPSRQMAERLAGCLAVPDEERETFILCGLGETPVDALPLAEQALAEQEPPAWATSPALPERAPFVGREQELAQLMAGLTAACTGQGGIRFITGEAGQGKTALLAEFAAQAQAAHPRLRVAAGVCNAFTGPGDPFLPFRQIMAALTNGRESHWPEQQLVDHLTARLHALARRQPLLLLLDDLQWVDAASANLLFHLSGRLAQQPIFIVGAYRPGEVDLAHAAAGNRPHPLPPLVHELRLRLGPIQIELGRFEPESGRRFVDALLDQNPNRLPDSFRVALFWRTKGHPLFTVELLREMRARGDLYQDADGYWLASPDLDWQRSPARVEAVIEQRLARLDSSARNLLAAASVEGETFTVQVLAALQAMEERPLLHRLAHELQQRHQLVQEQGEIVVGNRRLVQYRFQHVLFQQYLYASLSQSERRLLHEEIADYLETLYEGAREPITVQLAYHYDQAGRTDKAITYLLQAGDRARALYAQQEAVDHYQRALNFLRQRGDRAEMARTLMKLGLVYHNAFEFEPARQVYEEAFALWQQMESGWQTHDLPPAPHPLRLVWQDPPSLDPTLGGMTVTAPLVTQLFSGLVGQSRQMEVVPDVAHSWELLDAGHKYVFHLRDDVYWSDGRRVTAADFAYTFKRALDPATKAPVAGLLLYTVKGAAAIQQGEAYDPARLGISAPDETTLVIELVEPTSYFLQCLSYYVLLPVPQHLVDRYGSAWAEPQHIVTNGPFILAEWQPGEVMRLARNPRYHGRFHGNVTEVTIALNVGPVTQAELYQAGQLDVLSNWFMPVAELDRLRQQRPVDYSYRPRLGVTYCLFNPAQPPLDDERTRRALAQAIDREAMASQLYKGYELPARGGFVPPGMPGHSPDIGLPFDPAEANRLLAEAGYPDGRGFPGLSLWTLSARQKEAAFLQAQWRQYLNIEVELELLDLAGVVDFARWFQEQNLPILYGGWLADYADPDNYMRVCVQLLAPAWHHDAYERLLDEARRTTDQAQRMTIYHAADRILVETAVLLPLTYSQLHLMRQPWLKRFPIPAVKNPGFWKDVVLARDD